MENEKPIVWGLQATPGARYHWTARAIVEAAALCLVWDRQATIGEGTDEERAALTTWLNAHALPYMRAMVADGDDFPQPDEDREVTISGDGFTLRANPRASYGYVYLSATADPSHPEPTPTFPVRPLNDTRAMCRCGAYPGSKHRAECSKIGAVLARQAREGGPRNPDRRRKSAIVARARKSYTIGR